MKSIIRIVLLLVMFTSTATLVNAKKTYPPIITAIREGDVAKLKSVIATGVDINATYDGETALLAASGQRNGKNKQEIIKTLLEVPGIDVNIAGGKFNVTPIQVLYGIEQYDNIVKLIKLGANVNRTQKDYSNGGTPLWASTYTGPSEKYLSKAMALLTYSGSELNVNFIGVYYSTATRSSVKHEYTKAVELLLKRGAYVEDVPQSYHVEGFPIDKPGLIFETVKHKSHDILDLLMKYGANKYGPFNHMSPPLHAGMGSPEGAEWADYFISTYDVDVNYLGKEMTPADAPAIVIAAAVDNVKGLEVLFKYGAKVDLGNSVGFNGLEMAAGTNSLNAAQYLIDKGANVDYRDHSGINPLVMAAIGHHHDMLRLLVKNGADINSITTQVPWGTPLAQLSMLFIPSDRKKIGETIKVLIELGADPNQLLGGDETALMQAAKLGTKKGYKGALANSIILIEAGAKLDLQNKSGETALMIAAGSGNKKLVELLIESGADVNLKSSLNETALSYAENAPFYKDDVIEILKLAGATAGATQAASSNPATAATTASSATASSGDLFGTWKGYNSEHKMVKMTFVVNKNNTYSFSSSYTIDGKTSTVAKHKGTIAVSATSYKLSPNDGQKPAIYSYKIENGKLSVNGGYPLSKAK